MSRGSRSEHDRSRSRGGIVSRADAGPGRRRRSARRFIALGSPWQNGFVESFNGKLRDELLNREWFRSRAEAKVLTIVNARRRDELMREAAMAA